MPMGGVNPSIRVYDYDMNGKKIINYKQHYLPLDELYLSGGNNAAERGDIGAGISMSDDENDMNNEDGSASGQLGSDYNKDEFLSIEDSRRNRNSKFMRNPPSQRKKREDTENIKPRSSGKIRGMGAPKYLRISGHENCLNKADKIKCLPSKIPKDCDAKIYKKLKKLQNPPPKCKIISQNKAEREKIPSASLETTVPSIPGAETDEYFPRQKFQEVTDASNMDLKPTTEDSGIKQENRDLSSIDKKDHFLVGQWKFGYDAAVDFNITEMTPTEMYNLYIDMKHDPAGSKFNLFRRDLVTFKTGFDCNETCHAWIMCSITNMIKDDVIDCLKETPPGYELPPPRSEYNSMNNQSITGKPETTRIPVSSTTSTIKNVDSSSVTQQTDVPTTENTESSIFENVDEHINVNSKVPSTGTDGGEEIDTIGYKNNPQNQESGGSGATVAVVLVVLVILIVGAVLLYRRRYHWRNRQSDEFLLTDSVFKYDGYSQVEQPA